MFIEENPHTRGAHHYTMYSTYTNTYCTLSSEHCVHIYTHSVIPYVWHTLVECSTCDLPSLPPTNSFLLETGTFPGGED